MAALEHFRYVTGRVRSFLFNNPDILPGNVLVSMAADGGIEAHAVNLGFHRDMDDLIYLAAFYIECLRLCCMGRGWVPYDPVVSFN
jgi:hypothetical protein